MTNTTALTDLDKWLTEKWSDPDKLISCFELSEIIDLLKDKERSTIIDANFNGQLKGMKEKEASAKYSEDYFDNTLTK